MGEFYAWAVTGQVTNLEVWSDANGSPDDAEDNDPDGGSVRIASKLLEQQKFVLRARDNRELEVHLVESGIAVQNGHVVTVAWAAREGAIHGHCVFVKNHSTGAASRLKSNLRHIRSVVRPGQIAGFGALAAIPAALAILAWLMTPGSFAQINLTLLLIGVSVALVVLFSIGAIVAKLVLDYRRSEDDDKIWAAVDKALAAAAPQPQRLTPRLAAGYRG